MKSDEALTTIDDLLRAKGHEPTLHLRRAWGWHFDVRLRARPIPPDRAYMLTLATGDPGPWRSMDQLLGPFYALTLRGLVRRVRYVVRRLPSEAASAGAGS